jgi:hypothetical protein
MKHLIMSVCMTTCGAGLRTWPDEYVKSMSPAEKQATDITRKTSGDRLIQMRTHHGTLCPGERLNDVKKDDAQKAREGPTT